MHENKNRRRFGQDRHAAAKKTILLEVHQFHVEHQCGIGGNNATGSPFTTQKNRGARRPKAMAHLSGSKNRFPPQRNLENNIIFL